MWTTQSIFHFSKYKVRLPGPVWIHPSKERFLGWSQLLPRIRAEEKTHPLTWKAWDVAEKAVPLDMMEFYVGTTKRWRIMFRVGVSTSGVSSLDQRHGAWELTNPVQVCCHFFSFFFNSVVTFFLQSVLPFSPHLFTSVTSGASMTRIKTEGVGHASTINDHGSLVRDKRW